MFPQNLCWTLIPNVTIFVDVALREVIKINEVLRVEF